MEKNGEILFALVIVACMVYVVRVSIRRCRLRVVIVGLPATDDLLPGELQPGVYHNMCILGCVVESHDGQGVRVGPIALPVLGDAKVLSLLIEAGAVDLLVMTPEAEHSPSFCHMALEAHGRGVRVLPIAALYEHLRGRIPLVHLHDLSSLLRCGQQSSQLYRCWLRGLDLVFALCGLLFLACVLPMLAVLITLDSPGPLFFQQERLGYGGRVFHLYKLRSMRHVGSEGHDGWVKEGDTRVTTVGRFLRATHLDELPQVINILRGEMSLIGPRPERPGYAVQLEAQTGWYRCRLAVKPGLTGWAQVRYGYGSGCQDELLKLQYDLYYIKYRSFWFDLMIVFKTVGEVLRAQGC